MPRQKDPNSLQGKLRKATDALVVGETTIFERTGLTTVSTVRSALIQICDAERLYSVYRMDGKKLKITRTK